jgi:hypothetical protein
MTITNSIQSQHKRDNASYKKSRRERGNFMLYVDENLTNVWYSKDSEIKGRGRPNKYSDISISIILKFYYLFNLSLSGGIGFVSSLFNILGIKLDIPDESRLSRRGKYCQCIKHHHNGRVGDPSVYVIDSTGFQIYGEGEWNRKKHGESKRKRYVKFHVLVDGNTLQIVDFIASNSDVHDCEVFDQLINNISNGSKVIADGAYGSHNAYDTAVKKDIYLVAKPKSSDVLNTDNPSPGDMLRNLMVNKFKTKGLYAFANKAGYWLRNIVENRIGAVKHQFGSKLKSRTASNQTAELAIKASIINDFTKMSMENGLRVC